MPDVEVLDWARHNDMTVSRLLRSGAALETVVDALARQKAGLMTRVLQLETRCACARVIVPRQDGETPLVGLLRGDETGEPSLLPCNHCGGKARYNLQGTTEWVSCEGCDATTPHFYTHGQRCDGATQRLQYGTNPAVKLWNLRA